jgi:hypothetical protein
MAVTEFSAPFTSSAVATEYQWSRLARAWGLDGILADDVAGTDLKVTGSGASTVNVAPGEGFVNGFYYSLAGGNLAVNVTPNATGSSARVDRVVLRLDPTADSIHPVYKTGGTGAPALTQDPAGIWEIPLAQCTVAAGSSVVTGPNVTDQRWLTGKPVVSGIAGQRRPSRKGLLLVEGNDIYMGDGTTWNYVGTAGDPAWSAYTPVWDATGTTVNWGSGAVNVGRYKLRGKSCEFTAQIKVGNISTWPTFAMGVTLPFAAQTSHLDVFGVSMTRGGTVYAGVSQPSAGIATRAGVWFQTGGAASMGWTVSGSPLKAASGDVIAVHGIYETA